MDQGGGGVGKIVFSPGSFSLHASLNISSHFTPDSILFILKKFSVQVEIRNQAGLISELLCPSGRLLQVCDTWSENSTPHVLLGTQWLKQHKLYIGAERKYMFLSPTL